MATVKGMYKFKDTLTSIEFTSQDVNFSANIGGIFFQCVGMQTRIATGSFIPYEFLYITMDLLSGRTPRSVYSPRNDQWVYKDARIIDFGEEPQTVSDVFYIWFMENAVEYQPPTVKGIYRLKDTLTPITFDRQNVKFRSNVSGTEREYWRIEDAVGTFNASGIALSYTYYAYNAVQEKGEYLEDVAYFYTAYYGSPVGWYTERAKTIDFGKTPQVVSDEFYGWLVENVALAVEYPQIAITQNGTTTLATARKYCDRDIDINVAVSDADAILDGSFSGEYASDKITSLKPSAFEEMDGVTAVSLPNCTTFNGSKQFYYATKLESVYLPNLTTLENGNYTFGYTKIKELDLPKLTTINGTVNPCYSMGDVVKINLPKLGGTTIGTACFYATKKLVALILGGNTLNPLGATNVFKYSNIESGAGYIYVPDDLVDTYKTATNWSVYADQIKPMSALED